MHGRGKADTFAVARAERLAGRLNGKLGLTSAEIRANGAKKGEGFADCCEGGQERAVSRDEPLRSPPQLHE